MNASDDPTLRKALRTLVSGSVDESGVNASLDAAAALASADLLPTPTAERASLDAFLDKAANLRVERDTSASPRQQPLRWWQSFTRPTLYAPLGAAALIAVLMLTPSLLSGVLPGQTLYPVKTSVERARILMLEPRSQARLEAEAALMARRRAEITALVESGGQASVSFSGLVEKYPPDIWRVSGLTLHIEPTTEIVGHADEGELVHVKARVVDGRLIVESIIYDNELDKGHPAGGPLQE